MVRTRWMDERGSALPLVAIVLGGVALALSLILVQAQHRVRVAQAQWAADGAARAAAAEVVPGLDGGGAPARDAALRVARPNGARLIEIGVIDQGSGTSQTGNGPYLAVSPKVVVEVEVGGLRARAAAARFAVAPG